MVRLPQAVQAATLAPIKRRSNAASTVASVYSSPNAFRSAESDTFVVLNCLAAWAAPYRWPTKSDDPGDAVTETKVVEPTGWTS